MLKSLFGAVSLLALGFASPILTQEAPADRASDAAASEVAVEIRDIDPALWLIADEDTKIYLFGTVHVLKPGLGWFDEAVKDAFDQSDELVLEVIQPDAAAAQQVIMSKALSPLGESLRAKMSAEDLAEYEAVLVGLQLPAAAFDRLKPWFAAVTLSVLPLTQQGYDPSKGADQELSEAAKAAGKTLGEVESFEQQMAFFDNLPEETQLAYLNQTVDMSAQISEQVEALVMAWGEDDQQKMGELLKSGFGDQNSELYNLLLVNRNKKWAEWVKTRLDTPGTVFLAVGAGHLAGADSLQVQLKAHQIDTVKIDY